MAHASNDSTDKSTLAFIQLYEIDLDCSGFIIIDPESLTTVFQRNKNNLHWFSQKIQ